MTPRPGLALSGAVLLLAAGLPQLAGARDASAPAGRGLPDLRAPTGEGVVSLRSPGSRMIRVPRSTFIMGSTPEQSLLAQEACAREPLGQSQRCQALFTNEAPVRRISLSAFWLDRTEVTVAEYRRCVSARRCRPPPFVYGGRRFDRPDYPVTLVSHADAMEYCRFRRARLPTEAEFERAARGVEGRTYPWGNLFNSHAANHGRHSWSSTDDGDGFTELAPVGSFPQGRTPDGFEDLAGNAAEWVADRYLPEYSPDDVADPRGPSVPQAGSVRVVRGGGYDDAAPWLRGAARRAAEPDTRRPSIGFRCARSDGGSGS